MDIYQIYFICLFFSWTIVIKSQAKCPIEERFTPECKAAIDGFEAPFKACYKQKIDLFINETGDLRNCCVLRETEICVRDILAKACHVEVFEELWRTLAPEFGKRNLVCSLKEFNCDKFSNQKGKKKDENKKSTEPIKEEL